MDEPDPDRLVDRLQSGNTEERRKAAFYLSRPSNLTEKRLKAFEASFGKDKDIYVRTWCALAIARKTGFRPSLFEFFKDLLKKRDEWLVIQGASGLQYFGRRASKAIPFLLVAHEKSDEPGKRAITNTFRAIGAEAKPAVPILRRNLHQKRFYALRASSAEALGSIGPDARDSVDDLIQLLIDPSLSDFKASVICGLGGIGPNAKKAIPDLVKCLREKRPYLVVKSLEALANIGPEDPIVRKNVLDATDHPDSLVRYWAVLSVGKLKHKEKVAVPVLAKLLNDEDNDVATKSLHLLSTFKCPLALEAIKAAWNSPNNRISELARKVLDQKGALKSRQR